MGPDWVARIIFCTRALAIHGSKIRHFLVVLLIDKPWVDNISETKILFPNATKCSYNSNSVPCFGFPILE